MNATAIGKKPPKTNTYVNWISNCIIEQKFVDTTRTHLLKLYEFG